MSILKGVVLEKDNKYAIILTADGQFKKIVASGNFEIGEEVQGREFKSKKGLYQRIVGGVAIAAALLLAVLVPGVLKEDNISPNKIVAANSAEKTVVAYVRVDINPSVELGLDENLAVKVAKPLNADGEQLLAQGDISGMNVSDAMGVIAEWCYTLGYINENQENVVNLTYIPKESTNSSKIDKNKLEQDIRVKVEKVMVEKKIKGEVKQIKELKEEDKLQKANQNKETKQKESEAKGNQGKAMNNKADKGPANKNKPTVENKPAINNKSEKKAAEEVQANEKKNSNSNSKKGQNQTIEKSKDKNNREKSEENSNKKSSNTKPGYKNENKFNEKNRGNGGDLGLRTPWHKIFELG